LHKPHRLIFKSFPEGDEIASEKIASNDARIARGIMDTLLVSAASGIKARMESLDMLANNLANSETTGFKADSEFVNLYQQQLPMIENQWTNFSQGALVQTGNPLNLALSGKGLFALNGPNGIVYTRNGNLQITKANQLATSDGYTLRNALDQGKPITVDPTLPLAIDKAGNVSQNGQHQGRIELARIPSASEVLTKLGNNYFALTERGSAAVEQETEVMQGHLEQSNVSVADSAVRLINVMRQFEMLQKAMTIGAQMSKDAVQQVARVG
jgi:flagellar basal-body rod protein FlgF